MVNETLTLDPNRLSKARETSATNVACTAAPVSIYDIRTRRRRILILIMIAFSGLILPFCDTVYIPALAQLEHDLHASTTLVDYTISSYLIAAGVFGLLWGPLSDRFGRKIILLLSFIFFIAVTIVCFLARTIVVLLIFRSLQGGAISASLVIGQSVIVDMYPAEQLGFATGLYLVPFLVGPIIGPFIGGALSDAFGWRSTFVALAIMAVISVIIIVIFVPETHHYLVIKRLANRKNATSPDDIIQIREASSLVKPKLMPPWQPLIYLSDLTIAPYIAVCSSNFATLFIILTLMSNREAQEPYSLSPLLIGVTYIPTGVFSLVGSLSGGYVSDWSAKRFSRAVEGRIVINLLGSLMVPVGLLLCGWTFHFGVHIAVPIIGAAIVCFGEAFVYTSVCAFLNVKRPSMAGAILALLNSINFVASGVGIIVTVPLLSVIHFGPLFTLLAGICFFTISIALLIVLYRLSKCNTIAATANANDAYREPSE